jgi:hypothetical protein
MMALGKGWFGFRSFKKLGRSHRASCKSQNHCQTVRLAESRMLPFSVACRPAHAGPASRPATNLKNQSIHRAASTVSVDDGAAADRSSAYPNFSDFHCSKPEGIEMIELLPVRKNHIEQNFYITKKNQRGGKASDVEYICAF